MYHHQLHCLALNYIKTVLKWWWLSELRNHEWQPDTFLFTLSTQLDFNFNIQSRSCCQFPHSKVAQIKANFESIKFSFPLVNFSISSYSNIHAIPQLCYAKKWIDPFMSLFIFTRRYFRLFKLISEHPEVSCSSNLQQYTKFTSQVNSQLWMKIFDHS